MVYSEFLLELDKSTKTDSSGFQIDEETFRGYISQINNFLFKYVKDKRLSTEFEMLKSLANRKTLEEVGKEYSLTRERIRQITSKVIAKINSEGIVERDDNLNSLFHFLCGIGNFELRHFMEFLINEHHALSFILKEPLKQKGFGHFFYQGKPNNSVVIKKPREKFAPDEEIEKVLRNYYFYSGMNAIQINAAATFLENDYKNKNSYRFSGKITWNKIVDLLVKMKNEN